MNIGAVSFAKIRIVRIPYYINSLVILFFSLSFFSKFHLLTDSMGLTKIRMLTFQKNEMVIRYLTLLDLLVLKEVLLDEEYERAEIALTKKDRVIVDIGAGFGDYAIMMAKKYPWTHVHAFEPDPEYIRLFEENLKKNHVSNITLYKKPASSLSDILKMTKVTTIDLLKSDCEGCEFQIFSPSQKKYYQRVKKIAMEYHENGKNTAEAMQKLLRLRFTTITIIPQSFVPHIGHLFAF